MAAGKKKTHSEYVEEIKNLPIRVMGIYKNAGTKILHQCTVCDHQWDVVPNSIIQGFGCPKCGEKKRANKRTLSPEEYQLRLKDFPFIALEDYKGTHINTLHKCLTCGHEWLTLPSNILRGQGCPICAIENSRKKFSKTLEEYSEQIKELNIKPIGVYVNDSTHLMHKCLTCDHEWEAAPGGILRGRIRQGDKVDTSICPSCSEREYGFKPNIDGYLYMLLSEDGQFIKIGISNNPNPRHNKLKLATPFKWNLVYQLKGFGQEIRDLERAYHKIFSYNRADFSEKFDGYTEWFNFTGAVRSIVYRLLANTEKNAG